MVNEMSYRVVLEQEDNTWVATSPDVPGAITQARSLRGALANIKEAIALMLDLPDETNVKVEADVTVDRDKAFQVARTARATLEEAQLAATNALQSAVVVGRSTGLSPRDIAEVTDVTYQRIAQVEEGLEAEGRLAVG